MKPNRLNFRIIAASIMVLGAVVLVFVIRMKGEGPGTPVAGQRDAATASAGKVRDTPAKALARDRAPRPQAAANRADEKRLRDLHSAGELQAIHDELSVLAESRQLAGISDLLRDWCREGSLELAQWCLLFSEESDPVLHLRLCAESLSNSSEAIRESAAATLENASGIRFEDSARANAWLASRPAP
jgi:hypothetical protein